MADERLRQSYDRLLAIRAEQAADRVGCPNVERLAGLLARVGDEDERLALLDHVMGCPFCQPEFELIRAAAHGTSEEPGESGEA